MNNVSQNKEDRIPFGTIDQIARMLEEVTPHMESLWDDGHHRMTKQEAQRLASYLARIKVSHSRLRDALKAFETLLDRNPVVLRKIVENAISRVPEAVEPRHVEIPSSFLGTLLENKIKHEP